MKNILSVPLIALSLFLITIAIYLLSFQGEGKHLNYFILLADAFLHGRLFLLDNPPWLNELVNLQGKFYVVYPPMPAILSMPFVYFFSTSFPQPYVSILFGAANVSLSYLFFYKLFKENKIAIWISFLFGFGTMHWYSAELGSAWHFAHIIAVFFLWLSFIEIFTKQRLFLVGLFIGFAYLARLPTILAIIFPLFFLHEKFIEFKKFRIKINFKNCFYLFLGIFPAILFNSIYNYLRFGVFYDISYSLLPIFNEPWYKYGLFNIYNIPIRLKEIFTALPVIIDKPPYLIPSLNIMALWFVTPAYFLIIFANFKKKLVFTSLITLIIMSIPSLTHGSNGFSQFGFRFALDYIPFLLVLTAFGFRNINNLWAKLLIILSIIVNLWGVVMISILGKWSF